MFCALNNAYDPPSCLQTVSPVPRLNKTTLHQVQLGSYRKHSTSP